jgi:hypothetical protein
VETRDEMAKVAAEGIVDVLASKAPRCLVA